MTGRKMRKGAPVEGRVRSKDIKFGGLR